MSVLAEDIRSLILDRLRASITEAGYDTAELDDEFDLLTTGVTDSLGIVELLAFLEQQIGMSLDFSELEPESLTIIGRLADYIEKQATISLADGLNEKARA